METETKFTPRPWTATHNSWDVSSVYASSGPVAECHIDSEVDENTQDQWELVKEANARLIAAAPDLLAVCQKAAAHIRPTCSELYDELQEAISKAIGA